jgi:glycine/serine hydroxymethyltransferase
MTKLSDAYLDTLRGAQLDVAIHSMYGSALTREYAETDYDYLTRVRRIAGSKFAQQLEDKIRERRERIATAALQGICAHPASGAHSKAAAVANAVSLADALIALLDEVKHG